jgi:hypothetical protein
LYFIFPEEKYFRNGFDGHIITIYYYFTFLYSEYEEKEDNEGKNIKVDILAVPLQPLSLV